MKLLTIVLMNRPDELVARLVKALQENEAILHNGHVAISSFTSGACHHVEVRGILPEFQLARDGERILAELAKQLALFMVEEEEERLLGNIITRDFQYESQEEISSILSYCRVVINGTEAADEAASIYAKSRRVDKIQFELNTLLLEHTELNWNGFLRFRAKAYMEELRDIAEYAVDEFVMDRQYQEFVSLLKYFVYIQEPKVSLVHLVHKGGKEFELLNEQLEVMETDCDEPTVTVEMLEKEMNVEDIVVSTLITISPRQIMIHTREPEAQIIKTIKQIFEDRVELCSYCRLCHHLDRSQRAEYNKL